MDTRIDTFAEISNLSEEMKSSINDLFENGGILKGKKVKAICSELSINTEELMLLLLPVAECFARAPISSFDVGAVVRAKANDRDVCSNLYLGANFEYENLSLNFSIHAEQAAVSNAWLNGESGIESIATSAAPCGHCRQFLYELSGTNQLPVIIPEKHSKNIIKIDIQTLLPSAFGPEQLGCEQLLMRDNLDVGTFLLNPLVDDEFVLQVLEQARSSYAPYTKNYAACGIQLKNGSMFFGRYAENVAHNPSFSAFSSAVSQLAMRSVAKNPLIISQSAESNFASDFASNIKRVVFVENSTLANQKQTAELLLSNLAKQVVLDYYQMVPKNGK
ncbi:MAG: cytidine deaminase [Gammaproteobacteria bacterium]|nr:MAG: cytidine deaminase [Gammaproteobacteria bacterium]